MEAEAKTEVKRALITGASEGIGRSVARALALHGYELVCVARGQQGLDNLRNDLPVPDSPIQARMFSFDLSEACGTAGLIKTLEDLDFYPDVLVNNAGRFHSAPMVLESESEFAELLQLNFLSARSLSLWAAAGMKRKGRGHIFSVVSSAGREALPGSGSYSVSKFALRGFMLNLREELKPWKVKVSSVFPGPTLTASWKGTTLHPGQFIQPDDISVAMLACLELSPGANIDEIDISPLDFKHL